MTADAPAPPDATPRGRIAKLHVHLELLATILLAIAAVATAWSSYQSSRWSGVQAIDFSHANAARVEFDQGGDRSRPGDPGRCPHLHPVGQRLRGRGHPALELLPPALPARIQARRAGLDRDPPAEEPQRAPDPVLDAPIQARQPRPNPNGCWAKPKPPRPKRASPTSAPTTTCSRSSSSPPRSSSPASAPS